MQEALDYSKTLRRVADIDLNDYYDHLKMSVLRSQRCQRNWDHTKTITQEQKDLLLFAATNCPTKQNNEYYSVVVTENKDIIEDIHEETSFLKTAGPDAGHERTNPQVLGNILIAFVEQKITVPKNEEQFKIKEGTATEKEKRDYRDDMIQAIGVAAGHVSMMAALLGLESGCCKCMNTAAVKDILTIKETPKLLMGIGYRDLSRNRRMHHVTNQKIGSFSKNIKVIQR